MNLRCLNGIILDNLAFHIDLTDQKSWDLNSGFTSVSLSEWTDAYSSDFLLNDFGLTSFDNGRTNQMYDNLRVTAQDRKMTLYRVGYNNATGGTFYDSYEISGITTDPVGNHFNLDGGYLQGFFKLEDYDHQLLPFRYSEGITIETIVRIDEDTLENEPIFLLMGARAEDKYNPYFSGETQLDIDRERTVQRGGLFGRPVVTVDRETGFTGIHTSEDNYLHAIVEEERTKKAIRNLDELTEKILKQAKNDNINGNIIAWFLTEEGQIGVRYINDNGLMIEKKSPKPAITSTGWTMISLTFEPNELIEDPDLLKCFPRRQGIFRAYVDGRQIWKEENFDEFFFKGFNNQREKQIGVPYNISWGGGSFGLKHSWHWDFMTHYLYNGESQLYINNNLLIKDYPLDDEPCTTISGTGDTISLNADDDTFIIQDECTTGSTAMTVTNVSFSGNTTNKYYIEFAEPLELLSNREYDFNMKIFDTGIFAPYSRSSISLVFYGTTDIMVVNETQYKNIITENDLIQNAPYEIKPLTYQYVDGETGLLINGQTGYPVSSDLNDKILQAETVTTGLDKWLGVGATIKLKDNTDLQTVYVGILIESNEPINTGSTLYINDWKYKGADVLVQDSRKKDLLVENNFDSSFIGGIQKLRIYTRPFNSQEILHNARYEFNTNEEYNKSIVRGGRIISG